MSEAFRSVNFSHEIFRPNVLKFAFSAAVVSSFTDVISNVAGGAATRHQFGLSLTKVYKDLLPISLGESKVSSGVYRSVGERKRRRRPNRHQWSADMSHGVCRPVSILADWPHFTEPGTNEV